MNNITPLHPTWQNEPEWAGPEEISIGLSHTGENLEAVVDRDDYEQTVLVMPATPFDGRVGYTLTDEQVANLAYALYTSMNPAGRALFHQQLGETA